MDPETVQRRFEDIELDPEMWEAVAQERKILLALVSNEETLLRYARNMAVDLLDWDDGSGMWIAGINQVADLLREKDDYDDLLRDAIKGAPAEVGRLLEWLIADGIERGVGFPTYTELEESFRLTLEKAERNLRAKRLTYG